MLKQLGVEASKVHVFGVVKRLSGMCRICYRGLRRNAMRPFTAFALVNIYLDRQRLMAQTFP
jgi:hypothetical protein